ncbi:MAG TPA: hypothetical protein DCP92_14835, partial [Nitrospiraceae bacterium]|nr:hypothetical protein [Nitrospiraceae bacterium]
MDKAKKIFCLYGTFFVFMLAVVLLYNDVRVFAENSFVEKGKGLFESKCAPCHTIGGGKKVGPDLQGINEKMPKEWLLDFISDPEKMFSSNDPTAVGLLNEYKMKMSNPGLSRDNVSAILDFLASPKGALQPPPQKKQVISMGDAGLGKKLFVGLTVFKNGGGPCIACHSVTGIGLLGGGNLGPDLTRIYCYVKNNCG